MKFGKQFPDRFFNFGAAEANMMSISCGLAATGKVPYASTFAIFATSRSYDQVRLGIAHNELQVRIGASHGGVSLGEDGASPPDDRGHRADAGDAEDAGDRPRRLQPGLSPRPTSPTSATGPMYMRFGRPATPIIYDEIPDTLGDGVDVLREGKDISIFACGHMVWRALEAAETLEREDGIEAEVVNVSIIKPLASRLRARVARQDRASPSPPRSTASSAASATRSARSRPSSTRCPVFALGMGTSSASRAPPRPAWSTSA